MLVLEDVFRLGPDPVHLGPVGQVGLVTHDEGQGQQGSDGCWLLGPETTENVVASMFLLAAQTNHNLIISKIPQFLFGFTGVRVVTLSVHLVLQ